MTNMSRMRFVRIVFHNIHFIVLFDFESPFHSINLNASAFDHQIIQIQLSFEEMIIGICTAEYLKI